MTDAGWDAFGGGPNVAVIISPDGNVVHKQSWLDTEKLADELELISRDGT